MVTNDNCPTANISLIGDTDMLIRFLIKNKFLSQFGGEVIFFFKNANLALTLVYFIFF